MAVLWQIGWQLLHKALEDKKQHKASPDRDRRLYCRLLLHYEDLLIEPAIALIKGVSFWCTQFANTPHDERHKRVYVTLADMARAASDMLEVFCWLLMETRKDEYVRPMARLLIPLHGLFYSSFVLKEERRTKTHGCCCESGEDAESLDTCIRRVSYMAPMVLERIAAAVPAECVDDKMARDLLPWGCAGSFSLSGRQLDILWADDELVQYLSGELSKQITFGTEYVEAMMMEEDSFPVSVYPSLLCFV